MPIIVRQKSKAATSTYKMVSGVAVLDTESLEYFVVGATTSGDAAIALNAHVPNFFEGLVLKDIGIDEQLVSTPAAGRQILRWIGTATWGKSEVTDPADQAVIPPIVGDRVLSYALGGEQVLVKNAITQTKFDATPKKGPPMGTLLNARADGAVDGLSLLSPTMTVNLTQTYANGAPQPIDLEGMINTVNSNALTLSDSQTGQEISVDIGEGLLIGAEGGRGQVNGTLQIATRIAIRRNEPAAVVDGVAIGALAGWDYAWLYVAQEKDDTSSKMRPVTQAVYKAVVYKRTAWTGV